MIEFHHNSPMPRSIRIRQVEGERTSYSIDKIHFLLQLIIVLCCVIRLNHPVRQHPRLMNPLTYCVKRELTGWSTNKLSGILVRYQMIWLFISLCTLQKPSSQQQKILFKESFPTRFRIHILWSLNPYFATFIMLRSNQGGWSDSIQSMLMIGETKES